jgi:hypothetical protein
MVILIETRTLICVNKGRELHYSTLKVVKFYYCVRIHVLEFIIVIVHRVTVHRYDSILSMTASVFVRVFILERVSDRFLYEHDSLCPRNSVQLIFLSVGTIV